MILMHGKIISTHLESKYLDSLYQDCLNTLNNENITIEMVIHACNTLYQKVMNGEFNDIIFPLLKSSNIPYERFVDMANLFSKDELEYKCKIELGDELIPLKNGTIRKRYPLGILFHIAAGNVDGLPAYSVIEGLLSGNINLLKLPSSDNGLSIRLLYELIQIEPKLKDFIYVFDVPSTDFTSIQKLANIADGIVVWGGDEAVKAARNMANITTKIIDWGHKLSFAYITPSISDDRLYKLACHICETNQVLCSSCQGIFVDTNQKEILENIGNRFYEQLLIANRKYGKTDIGMRGKNTLRLYTDQLEGKNHKILSNEGISVVIKYDQELELSYLFRNVWIKALPHEKIVHQLKPHKNHLQTCGLFCDESEKEILSSLLAIAGVVRITNANMSRMIAGEAHDGRYPLKEYSRIVEIDSL